MDNTFLTKLFLSFIVGGFWVTFTTIIAGRYGSKIGGWIGGLPTTTLIALLFIGITQSPKAAVDATNVIPQIIGFAGIMMVVFSYLINRGFFIAFSLAILSWFILTGIVFSLKIENFNISLIISLLSLLFSYYFLEKKQKIFSVTKQKINYTSSQILIRAGFAGLVIASAVSAARFGGPILGGIFSAFPAFFISTLFIVYFSHGIEFTKAIIKSLTLSGLFNVLIYVIAVRYFYPSFGLFWGTLIAYGITIMSVALSYKLFSKKIS